MSALLVNRIYGISPKITSVKALVSFLAKKKFKTKFIIGDEILILNGGIKFINNYYMIGSYLFADSWILENQNNTYHIKASLKPGHQKFIISDIK